MPPHPINFIYLFIYLFIIYFVEMGSHYVAPASLKLLASGNPPTLASQRAGTIVVSYHTQPILVIINIELPGEDSRWHCEKKTGLELALCPWKGESELHFQTDLCCPRNGKIPK